MLNFAQTGIMLAANQVNATQIAAAFEARVEADGGIYEANQCLIDRIQTLRNLGFYDKASLILTANGYKQSKMYALKPTSGAGDFAFTRAGTATRKGPTLVEPVPYNLLQHSKNFTNATWVNTNTTDAADTTTAPDGSSTADSVLETTANGLHVIHQVVSKSTVSVTYTATVHIKPNNRDWCVLVVSDNAGNSIGKYFQLTGAGTIGSTRTVGTGFTVTNSGIESETGGWYKCRITCTSNSGANVALNILTSTGDGVDSFVGDVTKGLYVWQAQLVQGSTVLDDQTTTDRNNFPRPDYTLDTCPSWLLEPQRTNLCLQSENFGTTWTNTNSTETLDQTTAPDGLNTADAIFETAVNNVHFINQAFTKAASSIQYSAGCWIKANGRTWCRLTLHDNVNGAGSFFDVGNGVTGSDSLAGTGFTIQSKGITAYGNGWYRCSITITTNTATTLNFSITTATADSTPSFLGDITKGLYLWGAQLEQASYATSYIPTTTATVTRVADAVTALTGVSSLIGQTEGTLYFEAASWADSTSKQWGISDGTLNNRIVIAFNITNNLEGAIVNGGVVQADIVQAFSSLVMYKVAITYKSNKAAFFINGVKIGEDLTVNVPACSRIGFDSGAGTFPLYSYGEIFAIAPVALSDAEAISLTQ